RPAARQEPDEIEPAAVSVTDMAARCQLSRSRFSALVLAGVFPKPQREVGRRPYYPPALIRQCLDIRRAGVGANGHVVMFNRRPVKRPKR
ncbi:MAG: hypothetical protein K2P78_08425, partial [Gemmataceae bacterium]|nr:hypothetical protein [Gemmataceae bacterium]